MAPEREALAEIHADRARLRAGHLVLAERDRRRHGKGDRVLVEEVVGIEVGAPVLVRALAAARCFSSSQSMALSDSTAAWGSFGSSRWIGLVGLAIVPADRAVFCRLSS
jgi:hypothetical protein